MRRLHGLSLAEYEDRARAVMAAAISDDQRATRLLDIRAAVAYPAKHERPELLPFSTALAKMAAELLEPSPRRKDQLVVEMLELVPRDDLASKPALHRSVAEVRRRIEQRPPDFSTA
jgi:hypothetical protein